MLDVLFHHSALRIRHSALKCPLRPADRAIGAAVPLRPTTASLHGSAGLRPGRAQGVFPAASRKDGSANRRIGGGRGAFSAASAFRRFGAFIFLALSCFLPLRADTPPEPPKLTAELLLRVLQERHMLVENKRWLLAAFDEQFDEYLFNACLMITGDWLAPITQNMAANSLPAAFDWGHGLPALPTDGQLNNLTMAQRIEVLNKASLLFDQLRSHFLNLPRDFPSTREYALGEIRPFTAYDMPSVGWITPENYPVKLLHLLSMSRHLNAVDWPTGMYANDSTGHDWVGVPWIPELGGDVADLPVFTIENEWIDFTGTTPTTGLQRVVKGNPLAGCFEGVWSESVLYPFYGGNPDLWPMNPGPIGYNTTALLELHINNGSPESVDFSFTTSYQGYFLQIYPPKHMTGMVGTLHVIESRNDPWGLFSQYPNANLNTSYGFALITSHHTASAIVTDPFLYGPLIQGQGEFNVRLGDQAGSFDSQTGKYNPAWAQGTPESPWPEYAAISSVAAVAYLPDQYTHTIPSEPFQLADPKTNDGIAFDLAPNHFESATVDLGRGLDGWGGRLAFSFSSFGDLWQNPPTWTLPSPGGPVWNLSALRLHVLGAHKSYAIQHGTQGSVTTHTFTGAQFTTTVSHDRNTGHYSLSQTPVDGQSPAWDADIQVHTVDDPVANTRLQTATFTETRGTWTDTTRLYCERNLTNSGVNFLALEKGPVGNPSLELRMKTQSGPYTRKFTHKEGVHTLQSRDLSFATRARSGSIPLLTGWTETVNGKTRTWTRALTPDVSSGWPKFEIQYWGGAIISETWNGPGDYNFIGNADGQPISFARGPFGTEWSWQEGKWTTTQTHGSTELSRHLRTFPTLLNWEDSVILGTETQPLASTSLWSPMEVGPGQLPWMPKSNTQPDGTATQIDETWANGSRRLEIFDGLADKSEGVLHDMTFDAFGWPLTLKSTVVPGSLTLRDETFANSPFGPTYHTATDGFPSSWTRDDGGRITAMTGRGRTIMDIEHDALHRFESFTESFTDELSNVTHTVAYDDFTTTHTASGGGSSHVSRNTRNAFGDPVGSGFSGPQGLTGTAKWEEGVFSSTGENDHTKATGKSTFNEQTLKTVIQANTASGFMSEVSTETLGGVPCLVVEAFALTLDENNLPHAPAGAVEVPWTVTGVIEDENAGYIGNKAIADLEGVAWLPPAQENILVDGFGRRQNDGMLAFQWNAAGQLLAAEQQHGNQPLRVENVYDGHHRRVEKRVFRNGQLHRVHRFVYEGWLPVVEAVHHPAGGLIHRNTYIWGAAHDGIRGPGSGPTGQLALIVHRPAQGAPRVSIPVYNWRMDVIGLVDAYSGNVVATYEYNEFGRPTRVSGARAAHNPFRFATSYYDGETGTYYFGHRHYDPRTLQFVSRDPIGELGGLNLYAYADNDPINGVDRLGLTNVLLPHTWGIRNPNDRWYNLFVPSRDDLRSAGAGFVEAGHQTLGVATRLGHGVKETTLIGSDMIGFSVSSAAGVGEFYEGRSDLFHAIAENPAAFGSPEEFRNRILKGTVKEVANIGTLGGLGLAEGAWQGAHTGDWTLAQDRSLQGLMMAGGARSMQARGINPMRAYSPEGYTAALNRFAIRQRVMTNIAESQRAGASSRFGEVSRGWDPKPNLTPGPDFSLAEGMRVWRHYPPNHPAIEEARLGLIRPYSQVTDAPLEVRAIAHDMGNTRGTGFTSWTASRNVAWTRYRNMGGGIIVETKAPVGSIWFNEAFRGLEYQVLIPGEVFLP
ncbi:MAG: RHS repeat-associated core domain-containing protein [Kiritimatiellae bacterium]|nr:RHS repeat-associated core domain-containing protein [Kiritimatiellia bacterium]